LQGNRTIHARDMDLLLFSGDSAGVLLQVRSFFSGAIFCDIVVQQGLKNMISARLTW
jgi:hypothetical protein